MSTTRNWSFLIVTAVKHCVHCNVCKSHLTIPDWVWVVLQHTYLLTKYHFFKHWNVQGRVQINYTLIFRLSTLLLYMKYTFELTRTSLRTVTLLFPQKATDVTSENLWQFNCNRSHLTKWNSVCYFITWWGRNQ